jgi:hypothetical protein
MPDNLFDARLFQMLNLPPGDLLIIFIARNMLRLSRQPSQQREVLGECIGEAVEKVVG